MKSCNVEGFGKHRLVHVSVQLSLAQRREAVELKKPRLQLLIEENVDAEDLVAGVVGLRILLKAFQESSMAAYDGLADNVPNSCPESSPIMAPGFQIPPESFHAPLVPLELARILVLHKLLALFVDRIICQVDVLVVQVAFVDRVGFGGEANEAIVVKVELDGVDAGQENIEAEIELEPVDEEGVGDVLLDDEVLVRHLNTGVRRVFPLDNDEAGVEHILGFGHKTDSLSAGVCRRLHNPNALVVTEIIFLRAANKYLLLFHLPFQDPLLLRQVVGLGGKCNESMDLSFLLSSPLE